MARDPATYVYDESKKGVWDRELPSVRLDELAQLFETASWMHRMHEVITELRWPGSVPGIITPNEYEREFEEAFRAATGFAPNDVSGYQRLVEVAETKVGRVVRRVFKGDSNRRGMYELFGDPDFLPEFEKEWVERKQGRNSTFTSIEEPEDEKDRKATTELLRKSELKKRRWLNGEVTATDQREVREMFPYPQREKSDKVILMKPFLEWSLRYAKEWFAENGGDATLSTNAAKEKDVVDLASFSEAVRLGYHLAAFCDDEYHPVHCFRLLKPKKAQERWKRYYDI